VAERGSSCEVPSVYCAVRTKCKIQFRLNSGLAQSLKQSAATYNEQPYTTITVGCSCHLKSSMSGASRQAAGIRGLSGGSGLQAVSSKSVTVKCVDLPC
jgi:hypothetical protein